jgi:DNA-binding GntR family transcriptional regulator
MTGKSVRQDHTLAQKAYRQVRERILGAEYPPGAVLSRRRLAEEFGMSLLPVAEALQRLVTEGLLESRPRVGTRVRTPSREEIGDRYVLREALESQSVRLFVEKATARDRAEILRMARQLDRMYAVSNAPSVRAFHLKFHLRIAEIGDSELLRTAIEREQDLLFNWLSDTAAQVHPLPDRYHTDLAEAVCSGDINIADAAIRHHIRYALNELLQLTHPPDGKRWRVGPKAAPPAL